MTVLRVSVRVVAAVLLVVLAVPAAWALATGDFFMTVTGRSMAPTYEVGDVLVVRQPAGDELRTAGTVVVVAFDVAAEAPARYVHRVVEPTADGAWLQGDNNADRDPRPVRQEAVLGTPRLALHGRVATAFAATQTVAGRVVLAGLAALLLVVPVRPRRTGRGERRDVHEDRTPVPRP